MFKIPLADVKEKILKSGKITSEELDSKLKTKINELSGLISEEGAAHIIANELGVELFSTTQQGKLKIKELYAGMRGISFLGKVMRKFEMREFAKGESKGKVCSIIVGDETGTMRVVFWNDQVSLLNSVNEEDVVFVKDTYVRENNGNKEVHFNDKSSLEVNPSGEVVNVVRQRVAFSRKKIEELHGGEEGAEIFGTIVQVFDPRFFNVCSNCGKKVVEVTGGFTCNEHGIVSPTMSYVMNVIVDDGTGTIRNVLWKNQTNHLLGVEEGGMVKYKENGALFEDRKTDLLGEQIKVMGRVQKNEMFDRLEFNVQMVERAKVEEEMARLENKSV